ncbi:MAG: hypothetical protein CMA12_02420 [Euryarchaeota archaeon]|nr:hypothetical protein [Euryarchaeota archaeon]OUW22708.1 MAG: hypothetical protein CBD33_00990 [Euryarchaeota archaeon TMED173]|tara:strand:- start:897 stop:1895 length:999 start_codon:yes stop_codon:yes gene_type:complete
MSRIFNSEIDAILEGTSRSFYLSLKELPRPIRKQVSLLYLLARTSDTIADSERGSTSSRLDALESFNDFCMNKSDNLPVLKDISILQRNESERLLLEKIEQIVSILEEFSESDVEDIRKCLKIIISGQILDLERFSSKRGNIISIDTEKELDDYAYRVAGSVGEFWTTMALQHLFEIDEKSEQLLFDTGIKFGKALQMINILRDIPADLSLGRCYIPASSLADLGLNSVDLLDKRNMDIFRPLYNKYLDLTDLYFESAVEYIEKIPHRQFRFRGACMLPVIIGKRTSSLLREGNVLDSENRIKIDRSEIKKTVKNVVMAVPFRNSSQKLLRN